MFGKVALKVAFKVSTFYCLVNNDNLMQLTVKVALKASILKYLVNNDIFNATFNAT